MLVINGTILDYHGGQVQVSHDGLFLQAGRIWARGPVDVLKERYPWEKIFDANGFVILPGFINAHTHFYSGLSRGFPLSPPYPGDFKSILQKLWWKLDKSLDEESIYYSAVVSLMESIRQGTTTFIDHHASPSAIPGSLDILEKAANLFGVRACFCYEVSGRDGKKTAEEGIRENLRYLGKCHQRPESPFKALFGIHASFTVSDSLLRECSEAGNSLRSGFHLHLCEDKLDLEDARKRGYASALQRLEKFGILNPNTILAHGVHLASGDPNILTRTGATLIHNPQSNLNNAVGMAPVEAYLQKGIPMGLGSDGWTDGMFYELRQAILTAKHLNQNPQAGFNSSLNLLWGGNSAIAEKIWGNPCGTLKQGAFADMVLIKYSPPTPLDNKTAAAHLVYGLSQCQPRMVIARGKIIYKDGKFPGIDTGTLLEKAQITAGKIWKSGKG